MWKTNPFAVAAISLLLASGAAGARAQSPRGEAELEMNGVHMTIDYGRPSLDGRDMIAQAPVGTVWRLGADEATTLSLTGHAVFGNIVVPKGEYSLFAERTSERDWMLVVNRQTGQWGTERDRKKDLAAIPLKWVKEDAAKEQLEIELTHESEETGILTIRWGHDVLRQRFRLPRIP